MGEIIFYVACSLDGYIAAPDGSVAWLDRFNQPGGEDYGYAGLLRRTWPLVMGANTYRQISHLRPWPYAGRPCYVLSHRPLPDPPDPEVRFVSGTPAALARRIARAHPGKDVWLVGGAQVAGQFVARGLVDEFIISIVPVLLGRGIPLFLETGAERRLALTSSRSYPSGIVQVSYRREK